MDTPPSSLPTLYEYYTSNGITSGLSACQPHFTLNNRNLTIYSGAMHYFRVHPAYWRDRLRKMRACGLNAVETYVPWNLHQPQHALFDFGDGGRDFSPFLDVVKFINMAQEEDLLVIVRPGPYICAEWEFGGLPTWLLRDANLKVRTNDAKFMEYVRIYFEQLLKLLVPLQFSRGGAIIAVQIENEYGNTQIGDNPVDTAYLEAVKAILEQNGIVELLFTSDTPSNGFAGTLPGVLATANFQDKPTMELELLKGFYPGKPLMVMEYWTGWFDHWTEKHHTRTAEAFAAVLDEILALNSSVNMYMFHGGTNWGFMNGGNIKGFEATNNSAYQSDITSYDYDAPLSEAGDYTDKYRKAKEIIEKHNKVKLRQPNQPELVKRTAYPAIQLESQLNLADLVAQAEHILQSDTVVSMEKLEINNGAGQSYGYVVYRKENLDIPADSVLKIEGHVCDTVFVLINGELKSKVLENQEDLNGFGYWRQKDSELNLGAKAYKNATLELVVENFGRSNYGKLYQFNQFKGLWQGNVLINSDVISNWTIVPLEFKQKWNNKLNNWKAVENCNKSGGRLFKATLDIEDEPRDTYIDMRKWTKGIIMVNGFVLGRHCKLGPQHSVYLPAPLLQKGKNTLMVFEHFTPGSSIKFVTDAIFKEVL